MARKKTTAAAAEAADASPEQAKPSAAPETAPGTLYAPATGLFDASVVRIRRAVVLKHEGGK